MPSLALLLSYLFPPLPSPFPPFSLPLFTGYFRHQLELDRVNHVSVGVTWAPLA